MAMTMTALSRCYDVKARPIYKQRPMAMLLTTIVIALLMVVIVLLPVATSVRNWIAGNPEYFFQIGPGLLALFDSVRYLLAILFMFGALSITYHFAPNIRQTYHFITPGALFVVIVWLLLGWGFRWYVDNIANYNATYGTVGGVIILLFLFYLDSLVLLVGAEINSEIDILTRTAHVEADDFREEPTKEQKEEARAEALADVVTKDEE